MPGHEKIVSVTIAPVNRNGISRPMLVMTGSSAFRSACLKLTTRAGRPLALAVRTKSWPSDSSMLARTNRLSPRC